MTRYLRLWADLLRLSWRCERGLTATAFGLEITGAAGGVGTALALRSTVNSLVGRNAREALTMAIVAALLGTLNLVVMRLHGLVGLFLAVEKVGIVLEAQLLEDLAGIDGVEHLERPAYLDRVAVLQNGAGRRLVGGMWTAIRTVSTMLQLAAVLIVLGQVSVWLLFLAALAFVPLWADRRGRAIESAAETGSGDAWRLQRGLFELAVEPGHGKEIRTSRSGPRLVAAMSEAWREALRARTRARARAAALRCSGWFVFVAGFVALLEMVVSRSAESPGNVVLVVTLTITLQQTVQTAVGQLTTSLNAGIYIEPYLWLREYVADDRRNRTGTESPPRRLDSGIRFEGVSYTYPGTDLPALDDVDVHLPAGSVVAIVGEYGSGKTTLVKLLNKFYRPDSGRITVDGTDLLDLDTDEWRARVSAAYQDFGRYPQTTFAEAVGLGDVQAMADEAKLFAAVAAADADTIVRRLPEGLKTRLGVVYGGVDLSEGQWQKTALARASMRGTPLLFVLDEPTASLDAPSEQAIFRQYMNRARGLAESTGAITVVVSHRLSTVAGADLVLVLDRGRLIESGSHAELVGAGGRYSELYGLQARAYGAGQDSDLLFGTPTTPRRKDQP